jgi:hypothetical protein
MRELKFITDEKNASHNLIVREIIALLHSANLAPVWSFAESFPVESSKYEALKERFNLLYAKYETVKSNFIETCVKYEKMKEALGGDD